MTKNVDNELECRRKKYLALNEATMAIIAAIFVAVILFYRLSIKIAAILLLVALILSILNIYFAAQYTAAVRTIKKRNKRREEEKRWQVQ